MTPMLSQNQVDSFQRDGFLNSGPVLDEGELDALRDELEEEGLDEDAIDAKCDALRAKLLEKAAADEAA